MNTMSIPKARISAFVSGVSPGMEERSQATVTSLAFTVPWPYSARRMNRPVNPSAPSGTITSSRVPPAA